MKTAIITGAAQGLGAATALLLAARGWRIAVVDINGESALAVADRCREQAGDARAIVADLTDEAAVGAMVDEAAAAFGTIDALVNNAGYGVGEAFLDMSPTNWNRTFDLNVRAVAFAMLAVGRVMKEQGSGRIVNVTSPASRMALPNYAAYAASKAAVDSLTRSAAVALAPHGIVVNGLAPGMMDTPMQQKTERQFAAIEGRTDIDAFLAERTRRIPLGRRATCEEVAEGIVWLAADAPPYVTAERLNISGGLDRD